VEAQPCHSQEWYSRIRDLFARFCWQLMGPVFITPIKGSRVSNINHGDELAGSPTASFTIVSGLHCSLAAMLRLAEGIEVFQPVETILVLPRIDY
jgi:hypothetical protein